MDTAEWDAVLAAGGRVELRQSRRVALVAAATGLVPIGVGLLGVADGMLWLGAALAAVGVAIVGIQLVTALRRRPVVVLTAESIAFREGRRMRTVPWANVLGARVVRVSWELPMVVLDLRSTRRVGKKRRAMLPTYLEVGSGRLRAWIDHQVRYPVRR